MYIVVGYQARGFKNPRDVAMEYVALLADTVKPVVKEFSQWVLEDLA